MKAKIYNESQSKGTQNTPEKNLWLAVLEQMLVDYNNCINKKEFNSIKAMIRQMENQHMQWICETCEIHPDRIIDYMYKRLIINKAKIDLRYQQPQRNI